MTTTPGTAGPGTAGPGTAGTGLEELLATHTVPAAEALVERLADGKIRCLACGHRCRIAEGAHGVCYVRFVREGVLRVPSGYVGALQIDPVEKKPFFHVLPGSQALSFGMLGCDLHCQYCQNWVTSQVLRDRDAVAPPKIVSSGELAQLAVKRACPIVVSTYNEPLITAEWAHEVFGKAKEAGCLTGFVSNGNGTPEVLRLIRPVTDLYKIDLKGFDDKRYRSLGAPLKNVLDTIVEVKRLGFWLEVVTLIIPGFNDGDEELRGIAKFLASVDTTIPWHATAFHPDYKMSDRGRTEAATLLRAHAIGREAGLRFVYAGNAPGSVGDREDTKCPGCGTTLVRRRGFRVLENRIESGACPACKEQIPGVYKLPGRC